MYVEILIYMIQLMLFYNLIDPSCLGWTNEQIMG
ncbi:hypothetical protein ACUXIC_001402 [Enterococcus lactis]